MLQISPSIASALVYSPDNQTALAQTAAFVPPPAPSTWLAANSDKKFYLEKSGDTYKLGSVTGNDPIPDDAVAVDLNVAYAIESKEMALIDWVLARMMDEIRQSITQGLFSSALSSAPEASLSFDLSSMSQSDLEQLLKRLDQVRSDLQTAMALGDAAGQSSSAAMLGLAATQLGEAMAQQALFQEEAATLPEAVAVDSANTALEDAQTNLEIAQLNGTATEQEIQELQRAVDTAAATLRQAQSDLDAADNFNEVVSAAYAQLVAGLTSELQAAQLAYSQMASSTTSSTQLSGLVGAAGGALNSRLASAADLALLGNPALSLFSALDVQQTDDGYVLNTSNKSARETQQAAVRAALEEALSDPALQTALVDAMAANADSLGTADMDLPSQMQLYNEVAAAVISAMLANDAYLDELASGAVDFFAGLDQSVGNDLLSASTRDSVQTKSMN